MHTPHTLSSLTTAAALLLVAGCPGETTPPDGDLLNAACSDGWVHDPDLPEAILESYPDGCVPATCGIGPWGDLDIEPSSVHVDGSASEGGSGSDGAPFTTIQEGLEAARDTGAVVAVAAGVYAENLQLDETHDGVRLTGRCAEVVVIDAGTGGDEASGVEVEGFWGTEQWWLSGITVTGAPYMGVRLKFGHLHLTDMLVTRNAMAGVQAWDEPSQISLRRVTIRQTELLTGTTLGRGISAEDNAIVDAVDCVVEGSAEVGIALGSDAAARLSNVVVRDTRGGTTTSTMGRGISVQQGASLQADHCLIADNAENGVMVSSGSTLDLAGCLLQGNVEFGIQAVDTTTTWLSDVIVRGTKPGGDGLDGQGIHVQDESLLYARDCLVEANADIGIYAGSDSLVDLERVHVRETGSLGDGTSGVGLWAQTGAVLQARHCVIEGNAGGGVYAGEGSYVHLRGCDVMDSPPPTEGSGGRGIEVNDGGTLVAEDSRVVRTGDVGIFVSRAPSTVVLVDVEVSGTQPDVDGTGGRGISVQDGASLSAQRCLLERNADIGVFIAGEGATAHLEDVEIRDTLSDFGNEGGRGINVQEGGALFARGCLLADNTDLGLFVAGRYDLPAEASLVDVQILRTRTLPDGTGGRGISVQTGATLHAEDCLIEDNGSSGIFATDDALVFVDDVVVRGTFRDADSTVATGVMCQDDARVQASRLLVEQNQGPGLFATTGGTVQCDGCTLVDNGFAGALTWARGSLELTNTTVAGNGPDDGEGGGVGVFATDHGGACSLVLDQVTVEDHLYAAVWLDGDGAYAIRNSVLVGGVGEIVEFPDGSTALLNGDGVVATNGVEALVVERTVIEAAPRAGLLLDGSSAQLSRNEFLDNDADVVWQACEGVDAPVGVAPAELEDRCDISTLPVAPLEFNIIMEEDDPGDVDPES
jgi:hypothetical protein